MKLNQTCLEPCLRQLVSHLEELTVSLKTWIHPARKTTTIKNRLLRWLVSAFASFPGSLYTEDRWLQNRFTFAMLAFFRLSLAIERREKCGLVNKTVSLVAFLSTSPLFRKLKKCGTVSLSSLDEYSKKNIESILHGRAEISYLQAAM